MVNSKPEWDSYWPEILHDIRERGSVVGIDFERDSRNNRVLNNDDIYESRSWDGNETDERPFSTHCVFAVNRSLSPAFANKSIQMSFSGGDSLIRVYILRVVFWGDQMSTALRQLLCDSTIHKVYIIIHVVKIIIEQRFLDCGWNSQ